MTEQTTMRFDAAPSYERSDFVLGACNSLAADWVDRWPDWPGRIKGLMIHGPEDCGKTHLGAIWLERCSGRLLNNLGPEDVAGLDGNPHVLLDHPGPGGDWPEDAFFHLLNRLAELDGSVLVLCRRPVAEQGWSLPDLASRLAGLMSVGITSPDDAVLLAMMRKIADDRGLALEPGILRYAVSRMERSFSVARKAVEMIDEASMSKKKKANLAMARDILDQLEPRLL